MAQSEQRRQKKLAARKKKQQRERQTAARRKQELSTLAGLVQANCRGAVVQSYFAVADGRSSDGMTMVYVTREAARGQVLLGTFVVDLWCMGVKDCYARLLPLGEFRDMIQNTRKQFIVEPISAGEAHAIVAGGVEYAAEIGLAPHADYAKVAPIFHDISRGLLPEGMEFGIEGKRRYIQGPYDSAATVARVIQALSTSLTSEEYDVIQVLRDAGDGFGHLNALEYANLEPYDDYPSDEEPHDENDDKE
jgi:hypothetical protein